MTQELDTNRRKIAELERFREEQKRLASENERLKKALQRQGKFPQAANERAEGRFADALVSAEETLKSDSVAKDVELQRCREACEELKNDVARQGTPPTTVGRPFN